MWIPITIPSPSEPWVGLGRLLDGDIVELQREWKEAEELAAISDALLLPDSFNAWIRQQRGRSAGGAHPGVEGRRCP